MRKTVKVIELIRKVNTFNVNSLDSQKSEREALNDFLETVLLDNECYEGFKYLTEKEIVGGVIPGIRLTLDDKFDNVDHTRVAYMIHRNLG